MGLEGKDMILVMILLSTLISQAITPTKYKSIEEEMRSYVDYTASYLDFPDNLFVTHVDRTRGWASQSSVEMSDSQFYVVLFDKDFVESQPQNIRKAIAGHEVGHSYASCESVYSDFYYGSGTYLESENCPDFVSSIVFGFENMYAALIEIKRITPDARDIDERIKLLYDQLSPEAFEKAKIEAEKEQKGLTLAPQ